MIRNRQEGTEMLDNHERWLDRLNPWTKDESEEGKMDAMKLVYAGREHDLIDAFEGIAEHYGLDYWYEPDDDDVIVMVLEGGLGAEQYAEFARRCADELLPTFGLEGYVPNEHLREARQAFDCYELEIDFETRY